MPLHTVQDVVIAIALRRGHDRVNVRPCVLLGDRVTLMSLAADGRLDPLFELVLGGDLRQPPRGSIENPPQGIRHPPALLRHENLLEHRQAGPAEFLRHGHGVQAQLYDPGDLLRTKVVGDDAFVHLGFDLEGDQLGVDESARSLLNVYVSIRHGIVHSPPKALTQSVHKVSTGRPACSVCTARARGSRERIRSIPPLRKGTVVPR